MGYTFFMSPGDTALNRLSDEQIGEIIQNESAEVERANAAAANANADRPRDVVQGLEDAMEANSGVSSLSSSLTDNNNTHNNSETGNSSASSIAGGGNRALAAVNLVNMGNGNRNNAAAEISED